MDRRRDAFMRLYAVMVELKRLRGYRLPGMEETFTARLARAVVETEACLDYLNPGWDDPGNDE
jgi:hypothetical protein